MKINGVVVGFVAAAVGVFLLFRKRMTDELTIEQKKQFLSDWANGISPEYRDHFSEMINQLSEEEISIFYTVVKDYFLTGQEIPPGDFRDKAIALFSKYQLGT